MGAGRRAHLMNRSAAQILKHSPADWAARSHRGIITSDRTESFLPEHCSPRPADHELTRLISYQIETSSAFFIFQKKKKNAEEQTLLSFI